MSLISGLYITRAFDGRPRNYESIISVLLEYNVSISKKFSFRGDILGHNKNDRWLYWNAILAHYYERLFARRDPIIQ